jgi:hypothetical protein
MSNPWGKFFWADWDTDPALKLCSFAAQGLWMRMLCIAAQHEPIGYVAVGGHALDAPSIARMTGGTEPEVSLLLRELESTGVFSRDRKGVIYSRRMIKDAELSKKRAKAGSLGGRANTGKNKQNSGLLEQNPSKHEANDQAKRGNTRKKEPNGSIIHSEPNGSVGDADIDPVKILFDLGVAILSAAGQPPGNARSLLGKWRKGFGDAAVIEALTDCRARAISNPVEWMPKRLAASRRDSGQDDFLGSMHRRYGTQ